MTAILFSITLLAGEQKKSNKFVVNEIKKKTLIEIIFARLIPHQDEVFHGLKKNKTLIDLEGSHFNEAKKPKLNMKYYMDNPMGKSLIEKLYKLFVERFLRISLKKKQEVNQQTFPQSNEQNIKSISHELSSIKNQNMEQENEIIDILSATQQMGKTMQIFIQTQYQTQRLKEYYKRFCDFIEQYNDNQKHQIDK